MYYATIKHHSIVAQWQELNAKTLQGAKREATMIFGKGFIGHTINLVECDDILECNNVPPYCKTIGYDKKWEVQG